MRESDLDRSKDAAAAEQAFAFPVFHVRLLAFASYNLMGLLIPPPPSNALLQRTSTFSQSLMLISLRLGLTA
jgi:hypothetical protein